MAFKTKEELLDYARKLEGSSVGEQRLKRARQESLAEFEPGYGGKGKFGQYIEEQYFGKPNDSQSVPDFENLGVELKTSPLVRLQNGEVRVKERLVLNMIDYKKAVDCVSFDDSHFLFKNRLLLLIFYFFDRQKDLKDIEVSVVDFWECLQHDSQQIAEDWEKIVGKIRRGEAHLISEGDTMYLGACTKGETAQKSFVEQPLSTIPAKSRAFCFKISYINKIYKQLLELRKARKQAEEYISNRIQKPLEWKPLEVILSEKVAPYVGKSYSEISRMLDLPLSVSKSRYANLSRWMLGMTSKKEDYYEFEAANIKVKAIRLEKSGRMKESMSFCNFDFKEIVSKKWEDSVFYYELTSKFVFMVFEDTDGSQDYRFRKVLLWNMPAQDLEEAHKVWERAKQKVKDNDYEHFPRIRDSKIAHVRPKGRDVNDLMETPQGTLEKKKCFWLNSRYIEEVLGRRRA